MTEELAGYQRKALRGMAHGLEPAVMVGQGGLHDALLASVEQALLAHELIKVRFVDHKDEKKALAATIAERCGAHLAGLVGHVAILYRPHPEAKKRRIRLPRRNESSG